MGYSYAQEFAQRSMVNPERSRACFRERVNGRIITVGRCLEGRLVPVGNME